MQRATRVAAEAGTRQWTTRTVWVRRYVDALAAGSHLLSQGTRHRT
ncbi:hypothetical protein [Streptomyces sp. NPDC004042]